MSRPIRDGATYFPLDVGFMHEKKIKLLKSEFGIQCIAVIITLFDAIYGRDGYFLKWDDDECFLMSDCVGGVCTPGYIKEVLKGCLRRSLFDEGVFEMFGVITSRGIQRRYLKIFERREKITMFQEYFLLDRSDTKDVPAGILNKLAFKSINVCNNPDKCNNNSNKCNNNPGKKSKEKKTTRDLLPPDLPLAANKHYLAAQWLSKCALENSPRKMRMPSEANLQSWADVFRLMEDRDNLEWNDIRDVLKWATKDVFWKAQILSAGNFRKHYNQLVVKMLEDQRRKNQKDAKEFKGNYANVLDVIEKMEGDLYDNEGTPK